MSFPRFRRHHPQAFSPTSSDSLSPTVATVDTPPISLQALAARLVPDMSLRKRKKEVKGAPLPSMFMGDENEDEENGTPNLVRVPSEGEKTDNAAKNTVEDAQTRKARTQYYDNVFNSRGPLSTPTTMVTHDSVVIAEIKTNVRVKEEESKLATDLSFRLAHIYQRPQSSIMISIQQGACLHFGNWSLPTYLMKVFGHPYIIAPITNLRNTALLQQALDEFLDISPSRGVIIYTPVPEENLAIDGVTMMGEIVRRDQDHRNEGIGIFKTITRGMSRKLKSNSSQSAPISTKSSSAPGVQPQDSISASSKDDNVKDSTDGDNLQSAAPRQSEESCQGEMK